MKNRKTNSFLDAMAAEDVLPISRLAKELWLRDISSPLRWWVLPLLKFIFSSLLHVLWFLKRLPAPQFSSHRLLQTVICWFCKNFVSYEANTLILRHFATESNLLNFIAANSQASGPSVPVALYPLRIDDMQQDSFVKHDQELFRVLADLGPAPRRHAAINWDHWRNVDQLAFAVERRRTQLVDFETAHILFMCLFCLLLTAEEYEGAINGFNFDQAIALRIEEVTGQSRLAELAYNKHPLFLLGPTNLNQRFLMHGFFTEYINAQLQILKDRGHL